ncbi:MAG: hypothetical protein QM791_20810 [Ferruginibacter sp.]
MMLKPARIFLFISVIFLLYGCPYHSPYSIDTEPQQYIDETLLGKWAAMVPRPSDDKHYREEPVKIIFDKKSDMEYDVAITGYIDELKPFRIISNDTIKATAFLSDVGGRQFLNTFIGGRYYVAEIKRESSGLSILMLAEQFTNKFVKNSGVLRNAIDVHYKTKSQPTYDDWFVAKGLQKVN